MQTFSYTADRWRYIKLYCPIYVCSVAIFSSITIIFIEGRIDLLFVIPTVVGGSIGFMVGILFFPDSLLNQYNIELDSLSVTGPVKRGLLFIRTRVGLEDINLKKSRCSFWSGSYFLTYSGKKMVVNPAALGMEQVRDLFARVWQMKEQLRGRD